MAEAKRVQRWVVVLYAIAGVWFTGLLFDFFALSEPVGNDITHYLIKSSSYWVVATWCFGWLLVFRPGDRNWGKQMIWAIGSFLCLLHIAIAFHVGHGWSHQAAWEHTKQVGGYGDGIYVNYLFALVWLADALWACVAFDSYRARPRWLNWTIHGFLAFVVFNAAVVFGTWSSRITFFSTFFVVVGLVFWAKPRQQRLRSEGERGA